MRVAPTMGRVTPTPTAASAINLSRPFPEVSGPGFPISSTAKRCKVKSTRRNRAGLFVVTADFRASAPRSARARSRPDTVNIAPRGPDHRPRMSATKQSANGEEPDRAFSPRTPNNTGSHPATHIGRKDASCQEWPWRGSHPGSAEPLGKAWPSSPPASHPPLRVNQME